MSEANKTGVVLGLWGDPGLTEKVAADFYSRFLIVQIIDEKGMNVLTRTGSVFDLQLVLRPKKLWIDVDASGEKVDAYGRRNSSTSKNILPITEPYKIGSLISLQQLNKSISLIDSSRNPLSVAFFEGRNILEKQGQPENLTTAYADASGLDLGPDKEIASYFQNGLPAYHFSRAGAFNNALYLKSAWAASRTNQAYQIFSVGWTRAANSGGRRGFPLFKVFPTVDYIDANIQNRERNYTADHCVPLVVANPSTFPTPITRNVGGVNINLTHITQVNENNQS